MRVGNLRHKIPALLPEELTERIVERIVSRGHASPEGFWYDQDEDELVVLLSGHARLMVEGEGELDLTPGDWVDLPARLRHRVSWTAPQVDTIWLAIFTPASSPADAPLDPRGLPRLPSSTPKPANEEELSDQA